MIWRKLAVVDSSSLHNSVVGGVIYVVPAGESWHYLDGCLHMIKSDPEPGARHTVDYLFASIEKSAQSKESNIDIEQLRVRQKPYNLTELQQAITDAL